MIPSKVPSWSSQHLGSKEPTSISFKLKKEQKLKQFFVITPLMIQIKLPILACQESHQTTIEIEIQYNLGRGGYATTIIPLDAEGTKHRDQKCTAHKTLLETRLIETKA